MKRTVMKLNLMPHNRKKPTGLDDGELVILTNPSINLVSDTIHSAGDIDWSARSITMLKDGTVQQVDITHYVAISGK